MLETKRDKVRSYKRKSGSAEHGFEASMSPLWTADSDPDPSDLHVTAAGHSASSVDALETASRALISPQLGTSLSKPQSRETLPRETSERLTQPAGGPTATQSQAQVGAEAGTAIPTADSALSLQARPAWSSDD